MEYFVDGLQTSERTLDAPDLLDDYYLNLLDWGSSNVLAIALGTTVYLWDASTGSTSELVTVDDDKGPVTSVNWAPDGRHIAVGLNDSEVQLWDSTANRQVIKHILLPLLLCWLHMVVTCSQSIVLLVTYSDIHCFVPVVEDLKRRSPSSCWVTSMEQSYPHHRINGRKNH